MKTQAVLLPSAALLFLALSGCVSVIPVTCPVVPATIPAPPPAVVCNNSALTEYSGLLVIVPHPDDEVLSFAGLTQEFLRRNKPVTTVVVTDGDAYCSACSFWKNAGTGASRLEWEPCMEQELAEFAEVRREEALAAQRVLGGAEPLFWNYPDTGIGRAWKAHESGVGGTETLRRSDCTHDDVYGTGSETALTADTLFHQLYALIAEAPPGTLIGTTHPLDSHPDHQGLGNMIRKVNAELAAAGNPAKPPKSVAFAVIHANAKKAGGAYPAPPAVDTTCNEPEKLSCFLDDTNLLARLRANRLRPNWLLPLPHDAPYVASIPLAREVPLCLPPSVWQGPDASKLQALQQFSSQMGMRVRSGSIPAGMAGLMDCSGYLLGFVRSNESFVLEPALHAGQ